MPVTTRGSVPIAYTDRGGGEPALLLMPGWCANRTMFDEIVEPLAERRRVLALDWRGHGESAPHQRDFGEEELVADARAVIDGARVRSVIPVAVAHSGWVAIELRRRLGGAVPAIVSID